MPWWTWIVLWIALLALSLLYVILLGLKVWREATKTMNSVTAVGDSLSLYWEQRSQQAEESQVLRVPTQTPGSAVFATAAQMKDDYLASKEERQFARRLRRVARRKERGQLQSLRDITALEDVG